MKNKIKTKIIILLVVLLQLIQIFSGINPVKAQININDEITLFGDHECDSLVEYYMSDYDFWSYKVVYYVFYNDNGTKYPAFCVEPAKQGVGTGYDSYTATIKKVQDIYENGTEKLNQIWRILNKGYMGSNYLDWGLECDDDFYSATKIALHSLSQGIAPEDKYILGDSEIDGNSVEEIQRRGEKVLNVAKKLYYEGLYGTSEYQNPKVSIEENGKPKIEKINDIEYYVQEYSIMSNKYLKSYDVLIQNVPKGTKILNLENEEITTTDSNSIKVVIPTSEIKNDIKGNLLIQNAYIKTNPIYYCKSSVPEAQSYVTYSSPYEITSTNINLNINANESKLLIKKVDEETREPLSNVKFEILDENKNIIQEVITNEKGEAVLENINPQLIFIKEVKTNDGYILLNEEKQVKLEYGKTTEVVFGNEKQKGNLKIIKVDEDDNSVKIPNVEFELLNSNFEILDTYITDINGEININNIDIGEYILREKKTDVMYYPLKNDIKVNIEFEKTSTIVIKNEKKKGQISIEKIDKDDNNIKIEGVKFEIKDEEGNLIQSLITNKEGIALTERLPIDKKYFIIETETKKGYILSEQSKLIQLEEDKIKNVVFENEKIKEKEPEKELPKLPRTGF